MSYHILTDSDVVKHTQMKYVIEAIERTLLEKANGTLVSPPRFSLEADEGKLVFTAGATTGFEKVIGFRVYDTYSNNEVGHEQLVAVFDSQTGIFKGIVIGNLLGAIRTGAIGGVAIKWMARKNSKRLAVIGTGVQARMQLEAAIAVREIQYVQVYSRNEQNRRNFANEMTEKLGIQVIPVDSAMYCVEDADIIICATNSQLPVIEADWLKKGVHINTLGPKSINGSEISVEIAEKSRVITTDSLEQLKAYSIPHFLVGTTYENSIIQLSDVVAGKKAGRISDQDITLYCSVGLSGTEVVVANEIMKLAGK